MADEITLSCSLAYADDEGADEALTIAEALATITTKRYVKFKQNIGLTEEAIKIGELTTLGWGLFINRDVTNFLYIKTGTGGLRFAQLFPGKFAFLCLGPDAQAPFAIANVGACQMEALICEV